MAAAAACHPLDQAAVAAEAVAAEAVVAEAVVAGAAAAACHLLGQAAVAAEAVAAGVVAAACHSSVVVVVAAPHRRARSALGRQLAQERSAAVEPPRSPLQQA